jgi:hypothetical protein
MVFGFRFAFGASNQSTLNRENCFVTKSRAVEFAFFQIHFSFQRAAESLEVTCLRKPGAKEFQSQLLIEAIKKTAKWLLLRLQRRIHL